MVDVFISYRRSDSAGYAGRLADSMEPLLGSGQVFRDIEDIKPGDDFVQAIERNLKSAAVFLVVIGKTWLEARDDQGLRRLDNPQDFVRIEIETALRLGGIVIPVLVNGATMPDAKALPNSLASLAKRQAIELTDSRWEHDIERLFQSLPSQANKAKAGISRNWFPSKVNSIRRLFLLIAVLAALGLMGFIFRFYLITPDISGNWYFERGDYLLIKQDGDHFTVEHIDPAMQTTYEKGKGLVKGRHVEFDLEPIYTQQFKYYANLELSWDEERLEGNLQEVLSDEMSPLILRKSKL